MDCPHNMDKVKIARSFSQSAATYDRVAYLQRQLGHQLLSMVSDYLESDASRSPGYVLDLGCGTGFFRQYLQDVFCSHDHNRYIGFDIAEGMLGHVQCQDDWQQTQSGQLVCGDAEYLPFADDSVQYIFSNLALQWCENLDTFFNNAQRIIADDGIFAFSTLGPRTLFELKRAWAQVDDLVHVNHFFDRARWQSAIEDNGFSIVETQQQDVVLEYASVKDLLYELKQLGAHNTNAGQRQTLTGRQRLQHLYCAYAQDSTGSFFPATYEVYFWVLKKDR